MTTTPDAASEQLRRAHRLHASLVADVDRFRLRQRPDGTVADPHAEDEKDLGGIRDQAVAWYTEHGFHAQAEALDADVRGWLGAGIDTVPDFTRSRDALAAPEDGADFLFVAPLRNTNGVAPVGQRLECFYGRREEPDCYPELQRDHPHPKNNSQCVRLLAGSAGIAEGNCLVFFPENVAAPQKPPVQPYAMFLFSKFRRIHETYALPGAEAVLEEVTIPRASTGMSAYDCYQARSVWGYLHDSAHYQGPWPFDEHIALKMNWFVGVLEEIKVDAKTVIACADGDIARADAVIDMILLERIFRYPLEPDATRLFDSGTGVFLYSWFREAGAITAGAGGLLRLDREAAIAALRVYEATIEALERSVSTEDEYRERAKALVRRYLPPGEGKDRYRFTDDQRVLLRAQPALAQVPPLRFGIAAW
ncbi:hypothetical protein GCM10009830_00030 [Glycomyces endophyticus]|uniref:Uncharacterized protein n=1 Tax=Glycomyces endophyticus TaxID=480996 RepID=A0ABP4RTC8_9ACTN